MNLTHGQAELLDSVRRMIEAMRRHPTGSAAALLLENFLHDGRDFEACDLMLDEVRRANTPVVLAFEMPGYITLGHVGDEITLPDPKMDGLYIAEDVFTHGLNAPVVIRASDFGKTPDAARIATKRAAEWVERYCPQLAVAIRAISFCNNGRPTFTPANPIDVRVFSAYSANRPP